MLKELKTIIQQHLNKRVAEIYNVEASLTIEKPKNAEMGDIAVPVFALVKLLRKSPMEIAPQVKAILEEMDYFKEVTVVGGFVNAFYSREKLSDLIFDSLENRKEPEFKGTVAIDYSSPNIAKPFSIGHLRSTIIGQSIGNILNYQGYKAVRINHLGDFGTQFGKMIYAYTHWGNQERIDKDPITELVRLYVRFHEEAEKDPSLDDEARKIFMELENGDEEYNKLWEYFRTESSKEFKRMYDLLSVSFDEYSSEAMASRRSARILSMLEEKNLMVKDDGAMIVRLSDESLPPAIIKKRDGSTLYITRDLEEIFDRYDKYKFDKILYCVGNEQKLYFNQLKNVVKLMDAPFKDAIQHVNFGLVLTGGKKMSTRSGKTVKLEDVLNAAVDMALVHIEEKNPGLENKKEIAKQVGISAIIFNDLKNYRENDYEFNIEEATKFEGQTGPYLQYTSVRISSILSQASFDKANLDKSLLNNDNYFEIVKKLDEFEDSLDKAVEEYAPSYVAKYLLNLASLFNSFYSQERVLSGTQEEQNTKLYLLSLIKKTIDKGLELLNMSVVEKM